MRRTVNEARAPSPRLRITTPSNAWVRSFSPSTTFPCTRTVSPGSNPRRSFLSCPASTNRMASMTVVLSGQIRLFRLLAALEPLDQCPLARRERHPRQQLRPPAPRPIEGLLSPPARDARVIAGQQHGRNARAPELLRARVLRRLQQPVGE